METMKEVRSIERDTIITDSVFIYKTDSSMEVNRNRVEKIVIREIDSIYNATFVEDLKYRYEATIDSLNKIKKEKEQVPYPVKNPINKLNIYIIFLLSSAIAVYILWKKLK